MSNSALPENLKNTIGFTIIIGVLLIGSIYSTYKNTKSLGVIAGIAFSVFCFIYSIGAIIAVCGLVIVFLRMIFQIILLIFGLSCVGAILSGNVNPTPKSSTPLRKEEYRSLNGKYYDNQNEAIWQSNKWLHEHKKDYSD